MFIPLHDETDLLHIRRPLGVFALLTVTVLSFVLVKSGAAGDPDRLVVALGLIPAVIFGEASLAPDLAIAPAALTPLTSLFLHGDVFHLAGNMLFLWVFGDNVEDAMGSARFVLFYVLCGVAASFAYALAWPLSEASLIGASGAVSGVVAAYFMLHPHVRVFGLVLKWIPIRIKALYVILAWAALQVFSAVAGGDPSVGWWAHVGGLFAGGLLIALFKRREVALFDKRLK